MGFEPTASWSRTRRSTKLSHSPKLNCEFSGAQVLALFEDLANGWLAGSHPCLGQIGMVTVSGPWREVSGFSISVAQGLSIMRKTGQNYQLDGRLRRDEKKGIVTASYRRQYKNQMKKPANHELAFTFAEVLIAILLMAVFCSSVFELNAVSLRYIDASKESIAALESVHDRCEALRNLDFTTLTSSSSIQSLLASPPNGSDFCKKTTEVVTLRSYPTANGITQFTRTPNGTVTTNSVATDLGTTLVQVDVSTSWNMTLAGRPRSEQTTTIISNGTKK